MVNNIYDYEKSSKCRLFNVISKRKSPPVVNGTTCFKKGPW